MKRIVNVIIMLTCLMVSTAVLASQTGASGPSSPLEKVTPILFGGALTLLGGLITQGLFLWLNRRHERNVLLVALRTEIKLRRETLGTDIQGFRVSLQNGETPRPDALAPTTPIFNANVGKLGQIGEVDLVEYIVEVYDSLASLAKKATFFERIPNERIELRDLNEIHLFATLAHVQVMTLHKRLLNVSKTGQSDQNETEVESRRLATGFEKNIAEGTIADILNKKWTDA